MSVDIHFHILPAVDDGPGDIEESLELARLAVADGTRTVVATPHVAELDPLSVPGRVGALQRELDGARVPLTVLPGGELPAGLAATLSDRALESVAAGPPEARWLLLEAPLGPVAPEEFGEQVGIVRERGFGVVIAHPERSVSLMSEREQLLGLAEAGARLQISAPSLLGHHGAQAQRGGLDLLASGHADLLASDAHSPERPPCVQAGIRAAVAAGADEDALRMAAGTNPALLVQADVASTGRSAPSTPAHSGASASSRS